jgi:hypothetical protein
MSQLSQSSVKINLDDTLEKKTITNLGTLKSQPELDISNPDIYFAQYEHSENIIQRGKDEYRTTNSFVNTFLDAYNFHKTLIIRPDDIKLQILMIISVCINNNPEKFRSHFVEHEGKKELIISNSVFSADYFCRKFGDLLEENILDKEFAQHFKSKFSTTNQIISTVNNLTLMNSLKEYFSFTMVLDCGIPEIILEGNNDDWAKLVDTYEFFKKLFAESELKPWFRHFDKVLNLFILMRKTQQIDLKQENTSIMGNLIKNITGLFSTNLTNTTANPEDMVYIKEMWKRVITYIPQGSGGDQILGGWVRLFVPYNSKNKIIAGLDQDIPCLDINFTPPDRKKINYYSWQDKMKQFYLGGGWGEMFSSCVTTPAKLIYYDQTEYQVEFYSGFFEPNLTEFDEIKFNIGYIMREDQQIKKDSLKKQYLRDGVKIRDSHSLNIPRHLQKKINEILDVFNACSYSYFGVDPEEEARKQHFIDEGIKIEKSKYGSKIIIAPEKYKGDENTIEELKHIFNTYIVKFY